MERSLLMVQTCRLRQVLSSKWLWTILVVLLAGIPARAGEGDMAIPDLREGKFTIFGIEISAWRLLFWGACVIAGTLGFSLYLRSQIRKLPAHKSMLDVAEIIFQTCKTYLIQQGKFLLMLFAFIAAAISFYLWYSASTGESTTNPFVTVLLVL